MGDKLKVGDILIDDTPMDLSFVEKMTDKEYEQWVKDGCPTPKQNNS